ncbi:multidrug ABC transporter ATP-binding protein [Bacillus safensis FO-36b] [Bacillus safensis subsp. safensis]
MASSTGSELDALMKTYDRLPQEFKDQGGYQYEADCPLHSSWTRL